MSYPMSHPQYSESYLDFFRLMQHDFEIFVVRGLSRYRGQGIFPVGYRYCGRKKFIFQRSAIPAAVIYNQGWLFAEGGKDWTVINKGGLCRVARYKDRTHSVFARYMKPAFRVRTKHECREALTRIASAYAVFKPIDGREGEGVVIAAKERLLGRLSSYHGLIEEFIDTSNGIPGLARSYHDLRVFMFDGKAEQAYIRIPKKGSLVANVARGGSMREFSVRRLPHNVMRITKAIDRSLTRFGHRIYAADFGIERGRPYLIELNDHPGLPFREEPSYHHIHKCLRRMFLTCVNDIGENKKRFLTTL